MLIELEQGGFRLVYVPNDINIAPVAVDDVVLVAANQSISVDVLANDKDAEGQNLSDFAFRS